MNAPASIQARPSGTDMLTERVRSVSQTATVNSLTFLLYCYFLIDYYLHISTRFPAYGAVRPTLLLVLAISGLLVLQAGKFRDNAPAPIIKAVWILIGYLVVSLPLVEWPGSVISMNMQAFVKAVVFMFFTAFVLDTDRRLKIFVALWIGLQVIRVLEPLYLNLTEGYWGDKTWVGNGEFADRLAGAPSDVANPNELGFIIVTAIPFLHYLCLGSRNLWLKLVYFALLPPMLYALVLTASRGAFIALLVVGWMVFRESRYKPLLVIAAIAVAGFAWTQMSDFHKERYLSIFSNETSQSATARGRTDGLWKDVELGLRRPIVGHGLGTTPEAKFNTFGGRAMASHSLYTELWIEIGIIGLALFLTLLWRIYGLIRENQQFFREWGGKLPERAAFHIRLNSAMQATFWMYAVYSINYWGLSQPYWYLLGGLCVAFSRSLLRNRFVEAEVVQTVEPEPDAERVAELEHRPA